MGMDITHILSLRFLIRRCISAGCVAQDNSQFLCLRRNGSASIVENMMRGLY